MRASSRTASTYHRQRVRPWWDRRVPSTTTTRVASWPVACLESRNGNASEQERPSRPARLGRQWGHPRPTATYSKTLERGQAWQHADPEPDEQLAIKEHSTTRDGEAPRPSGSARAGAAPSAIVVEVLTRRARGAALPRRRDVSEHSQRKVQTRDLLPVHESRRGLDPCYPVTCHARYAPGPRRSILEDVYLYSGA